MRCEFEVCLLVVVMVYRECRGRSSCYKLRG